MSIFYSPQEYPEEYKSWESMKDRCYRANNQAYARYGARGIRVCDRWRAPRNGFKNFMEDMGAKPSYEKTPNRKRPLYTLDRIDVDGDYCPENCRWATWEEQARNKTNNVLLTYKGETLSVTDWSKILGIKRSTIFARLRYGYTASEALCPKRYKSGPSPKKRIT